MLKCHFSLKFIFRKIHFYFLVYIYNYMTVLNYVKQSIRFVSYVF